MPTFTEDEQAYINQTYALPTIINYALASNFTLDPSDMDQVRSILLYRHDVIGGIRQRGHTLMHSIFHKLGYDNDGITTLEEVQERRMKIQTLERAELMEARKKAIARLNEEILKLTTLRDKIEAKNNSLQTVSPEEKEKINEEIEQTLRTREKEKLTAEMKEIELNIQNMRVRELQHLCKKNGFEGYSRLRRDELIEFLIERLA